jgi:hypothetical protein
MDQKNSVQINKLLCAIYYNGGNYETQGLTCVSVALGARMTASVKGSDSLAGWLLAFLLCNPDGVGSTFLGNVGKIPADYMVSHFNYH